MPCPAGRRGMVFKEQKVREGKRVGWAEDVGRNERGLKILCNFGCRRGFCYSIIGS